MNELALFAGAGGGILGGHLLGWRTVAAVEIEEYPRAVLLQRQADGILPRFPVWDDVCTFDGHQWRGKVDVISGGFPCQDISAAGKGAGITGERSGLWSEMARIIGEVRPGFVFVENSPVLTIRGLGTVLGDLATLGYDAQWGVLGAHHAGAPHKRDRIWILAHAKVFAKRTGFRKEEPREIRGRLSGNEGKKVGDTISPGLEGFPGNEPEGNQPGRLGEDADRPARPSGIRWWDRDPADLADAISAGSRDHGRAHNQGWKPGETRGEGVQPEDGETYTDNNRPSGCHEADLPDAGSDAEGSAQGNESGRSEPGEAEPDIRSGGEIWSDSPDSGGIWPAESRVGRVAHGVAHRVDRLKAIGNGQVSIVAALAWNTLYERINGGIR